VALNASLNRYRTWERMVGILPAFIIYSFVIVFSLGFSLYFSTTDWMGGRSYEFIGLQNYARLLNDPDFWLSVRNTLVITLLNVVGQVGLGFFFAIVLANRFVRAPKAHQTLIFFPVVLSPIVVGLIWRLIYNSRSGLLNLLLRSVGLGDYIMLWLDDPSIVLIAVSIPVIWQFAGLYLVILLGAIHTIPKSVIESSLIDGATPVQQTFRIVLPMIYPTFKVAMMICVAGTMRIFDHIFVTTGGGPGKSSMTMTMYNYNVSFTLMRFAYGATMAIGIMIIIFGVTGLTTRALGGKRYE
jgi:raffinose/stachyose/melibiose transport system permease protein